MKTEEEVRAGIDGLKKKLRGKTVPPRAIMGVKEVVKILEWVLE